MKKSTIWMLATVMGFAFAGLLYLQVSYISIIMKTSNEQFDTTVRRCLEKVSGSIERDEVYRYLEEDIKSGGKNMFPPSVPKEGLSMPANVYDINREAIACLQLIDTLRYCFFSLQV